MPIPYLWQQAMPADKKTESARQLNLLHVEDSHVDALLTSAMIKNIRNYEFNCQQATSLEDALKQTQEHNYDLILLDLNLPDSDGMETLTSMRNSTPKCPIIIITANDDDSFIAKTIEFGAQDYLLKGQINTELLKRTIQAAIFRKKSEEALKTSEERFQLAVNGTSDGIWDWNILNNEVYLSERWMHLLGYAPNEFEPSYSSWKKLVHPEDQTTVFASLEDHLENQQKYHTEYRMRTKSQGYRWFLARGQAIWNDDGKPIRMTGSISDIHSRKLTEQELKKSQEQLTYALEANNDGYWDWNIESGHVYYSPRYETMLGFEAGELRPDVSSWKNRVHPEDIEVVNTGIQKHLNGLLSNLDVEYRMKNKDDNWIWMQARGHIVKRNSDGNATRMLGTLANITRRKNSEQALKESEKRFYLAIEGVNDGIWDWPDVSQNAQYWSPRFKELLGYQDQEIEASYSKFLELLHKEDIERVKEAINDHFENDKTFNIEYRLYTKSNDYNWFQARGKASRDDLGRPVRMTGSISDITEQKKDQNEKLSMEMQLRQTQKLEAIGQLAAGIAHEINTPAQFVGDNVHFLKDSFSDFHALIKLFNDLINSLENDSVPHEIIQKIKNYTQEIDLDYLLEEIPTAITQSLDGTERISSIVKAMKEFSHPGSTEKEFVDMNKAIENTITVSRNEWKYVADIETELDPELIQIKCLPGELNQTVLNIIVNAAHAIGEKLEKTELERGQIKICTENMDNGIIIKISDNGPGIPDTIKNKIFDPFFTTKEVGKGTGQGLSIAYSVIVEKHHGTIDIESEPGEGTTFVITLPITSDSDSDPGDYEYEKARAVC